MKRIICCVLCLTLLCGCGFIQRDSYVSVTPHNENYSVAVDSDVLMVRSYLSLKNALLNLVEDRVEDAVLRTESYSGNLSVDLSRAVEEVTENTPLGAYAVSSMTYDFSRVVSYYEIHVNTTFRKTTEEINAVQFVTDINGVRVQLRSAMEQYARQLVLRVGAYEPFDVAEMTEEILLEHPEYALELPEVTVSLYPDSGTQRIMEIRMAYTRSSEELVDCQTELNNRVSALHDLYLGINSNLTKARLLLQAMTRSAVLTQRNQRQATENSAYGALVESQATDCGFALGYCLLLRHAGIPCELIRGSCGGQPHTWCWIQLDESGYYVDPSLFVGKEVPSNFLMGDEELAWGGYDAEADYPDSVLPIILKNP